MAARNLLGRRFGRLLVIRQAPTLRYSQWVCRCDCGNTVTVSNQLLQMGERNSAKGKRSCGCLRQEFARRNGKRSAALLNTVYWPLRGRTGAPLNDGGALLAHFWKITDQGGGDP